MDQFVGTYREFKRPYIIEQDKYIVRKGASIKDEAEMSIYDFREEDNLEVELIQRPRFKINKNKFGECIYLRIVVKVVGRYH